MAKPILRIQAREMRRNGESIKDIAHTLSISTSTASLWCHDIRLSQAQISELERRSSDPYYGKRLEYVRKQQQERQQRIHVLRKDGIRDVGTLKTRELFCAGVCLYWAEGFKKDNQVGFSNSDASMVKFFIIWLNQCCDIEINRLRCRIGINESHSHRAQEIERYWSEYLDIPYEQFQKPYIQKVAWKKHYDNPNAYHGVLRIRVTKSVNLLRKIHGWIEGMKKNS